MTDAVRGKNHKSERALASCVTPTVSVRAIGGLASPAQACWGPLLSVLHRTAGGPDLTKGEVLGAPFMSSAPSAPRMILWDVSEVFHRGSRSCPIDHPLAQERVKSSMSVLAHNLGSLWRRLALSQRIEKLSLTSLQQRLVKTGGRLVKDARY